ncbi:2-phosphosulfolactate phosphatase [Psychromicrobium silvestre]|uniref:Probable 2-phosphosulfolactate phosphatase n=1 Tax=Psychromicrobium silvestre TaxID=1645614 RepID=A0A7Y9LRT3_9MICC|nr:2-phosphosulfolactate phosphatase [Psychromicrobium silvestre]NYE94410.1 2-phosphosulfolactate phosphatase [Psychromicrobium silvestre]
MIDFGWGLSGALAQCPPGSVAVVHDILSFSTTVNVALGRGIEILPYRFDPSNPTDAARYAEANNAAIAGTRWQRGGLTLSPASIAQALGPLPERLVLPSPNGATISAALAEQGVTVLAGSLRSTTATARYLSRLTSARVISVAAGEHWPDGSLRPAIEDLLGAAALIHSLSQLSESTSRQASLSDQARLALACYREVQGELGEVVEHSESAQELIQRDFAEDVRLACQFDTNEVVALYHPETSSFRAA